MKQVLLYNSSCVQTQVERGVAQEVMLDYPSQPEPLSLLELAVAKALRDL